MENTTSLAKLDSRLPLRRHIKAQFPQLKYKRLTETYCTDTLFASVKSLEGYTCAQLFVGKESKYTKVYGMRTESQGCDTLQDFIRDVGSPYNIHNNNSKMQTSKVWHEILRTYNITQTTTEPYSPWQNFAERRIQDIKTLSKKLLDYGGADDALWYLALNYATYMWNKLSSCRVYKLY